MVILIFKEKLILPFELDPGIGGRCRTAWHLGKDLGFEQTEQTLES